MMPDEKARLLDLFSGEQHWCREVEARDPLGNPVWFDSPTAAAWDVTGALCHLFGWQRASQLFRQMDRHIHGKNAVGRWPADRGLIEVQSMIALQEFNDRGDTTFAVVRQQIENMPLWHGPVAPEDTNGEETAIHPKTRARTAKDAAPD